MPAIDPKSLPANLQPGAPARNLTPQEMRMAVAQMKAPGVEARPPAASMSRGPAASMPRGPAVASVPYPTATVPRGPAASMPRGPALQGIQNTMSVLGRSVANARPAAASPAPQTGQNYMNSLGMYGTAPKPFAKGGSVGGASGRADGCAQRGKTKGRYI